MTALQCFVLIFVVGLAAALPVKEPTGFVDQLDIPLALDGHERQNLRGIVFLVGGNTASSLVPSTTYISAIGADLASGVLNEWQLTEIRTDMPAGAKVEETTIVAGGSVGGIPTATTEIKIGEQPFVPGPPMSTARAYPASALVDDDLYVCGGRQDANRLSDTCDFYNFRSNRWTAVVSNFPQELQQAAAVSSGPNSLYLIGGANNQGSSNEMYRYDVTSGAWTTTTTRMSFPRSMAAAIFREPNQIVVCGGFSGFNHERSCEVYNIAANRWSLLQQMTVERSGFGLAILNSRIHAFGGRNINGANNTEVILNSIERLDNSAWSLAPETLPEATYDFGTVEVCMIAK